MVHNMTGEDADAPLTEAELASMRPAREVLPQSFFEAVERAQNAKRVSETTIKEPVK